MQSTKRADNEQFTFTIKWQFDQDTDLSFLGKYSDHEESGAIERPNAAWRGQYRYFIPAMTEAEHYKGLRAMVNSADTRKRHYGERTARRLARSYVAQDFERMESYGDSWDMQGCIVTLECMGKAIGQASLWSIESDSDKTYKAEVIADLKAEAYSDASAMVTLLGALPALETIETED